MSDRPMGVSLFHHTRFIDERMSDVGSDVTFFVIYTTIFCVLLEAYYYRHIVINLSDSWGSSSLTGKQAN